MFIDEFDDFSFLWNSMKLHIIMQHNKQKRDVRYPTCSPFYMLFLNFIHIETRYLATYRLCVFTRPTIMLSNKITKKGPFWWWVTPSRRETPVSEKVHPPTSSGRKIDFEERKSQKVYFMCKKSLKVRYT